MNHDLLKWLYLISLIIIIIIMKDGTNAMIPRCKFKTFEAFNTSSKLLLLKQTDELPSTPKIIWSRIKKDIENLPKYAKFGVAEVLNARISFMSGFVFDENGCISSHVINSPDYNSRLRFMESLSLQRLTEKDKELSTKAAKKKSTEQSFYLDEVIYLGGSVFSRDWQHAVIDFLPLYNFALPFILRRPNAVVVAGNYVKFLEDRFPFNATKFIYRDIRYRSFWHYPIAPIFFAKKLIYIDYFERDQSYTLPGSYDRIRPFLNSQFSLDNSFSINQWNVEMISFDNKLDPIKGKSKSKVVAPTKPGSKVLLPSKRNLVVYLDRSSLISDPTYVKTNGKPVGRNVVDQDKLLALIEKVLKPEYNLTVWTCKNFLIDRTIMEQARVIIGPHGGHFVNMIFAPPKTDIIEFSRSYSLKQLRQQTTGYKNSRWVFAGMSASLGHTHWFIEDSAVVNDYVSKGIKPVWSDDNIAVDFNQVIDTLVAVGVAAK